MMGDTQAFLYCVACSAALMILLDFFNCIRIKIIRAAATDFMMDTIWWITAVIVISVGLWESNSFSLRLYEFVAMLIGVTMYKLILSKAVKYIFCFMLGIFMKIFHMIFKIIKRIFKILLTPALFLYKILIKNVISSRQGGKS